jgi:lysophospholipase L1-like esterase
MNISRVTLSAGRPVGALEPARNAGRGARWLSGLVLALALGLGRMADGAPPAVADTGDALRPFESGDVVCFIGDSITQGRKWHRFIFDFYVTRFPDRKLLFVNAGISGDSATGAVLRLESDILVHRPTAAAIMFGMNDVRREHYQAGLEHDAAALAARELALVIYRNEMIKLSTGLREHGVRRLIYVTPSPYDQTAVLKAPILFGVNDALGRCGEIERDLARQFGAGVVDLNGPMTALNRLEQQTNATYSLVSFDRVHPGAEGQLVMAYLFLKATQVPGLVSRVVVDAGKKAVRESVNARVTDLAFNEAGLAFTLLEDALPWPIERESRQALSRVPLVRDLNREELAVEGLPAGNYQLSIDDTSVTNFTAEALGRGINLAMRAETPQFRQAQDVMALMEERRLLETRLRGVAEVEHWELRDSGVDFNDLAAVKAHFDTHLATMTNDPARVKIALANRYEPYLKTKPVHAQIRAEMARMLEKVYEINRPRPHRYTLSRVPAEAPKAAVPGAK